MQIKKSAGAYKRRQTETRRNHIILGRHELFVFAYYFYERNINITMKKYAKMIFTFLLLLLLPLILLKGSLAAAGVQRGLSLAYRRVLPALFPAMVVCGMIGELSEYIPLPTAWTVWLTSHLCGFPLGIKTLTRIYHRGLLSKEQTVRLSACCANASPAFLVVYAGEKLLGNTRDGFLLLVGQTLISLLIGLVSGAFKITVPPPPEEKNLLSVVASSFSGAAIGGLTLTGYVTFFAMLAALLEKLPNFTYLYGFLELTGGLRGGFYLAAAMIGFSGCAVLLQNAAYLAEERLPILPMVGGKCVYTVGMPLICAILKLF